jgi:hypothetical protein
MAQIINGEVAALFRAPGQAWEGGALMQPVAQAAVNVGTVMDVASLAAIYAEMRATDDVRRAAVATFEQGAMDQPLGLPTRLAWLASAMGVHVVLQLGEEPVLSGVAAGSLWGPCNPDTGRSESGLYGLVHPPAPDVPAHLLDDAPAAIAHRPSSFHAYQAATLSVGQLVRVVPLGVPSRTA